MHSEGRCFCARCRYSAFVQSVLVLLHCSSLHHTWSFPWPCGSHFSALSCKWNVSSPSHTTSSPTIFQHFTQTWLQSECKYRFVLSHMTCCLNTWHTCSHEPQNGHCFVYKLLHLSLLKLCCSELHGGGAERVPTSKMLRSALQLDEKWHGNSRANRNSPSCSVWSCPFLKRLKAEAPSSSALWNRNCLRGETDTEL